jgi:hypothetical protein
MRGFVFFSVVLALLIAGKIPAWSQTCGGATTYVSSQLSVLGGTLINTPIDVPGAENNGTILSPAAGSIDIDFSTGLGDYILGADFWNAIESTNCNTNTDVNHADCNDDPEAVADGSQFTLTSLAGNASEVSGFTAPDSVYIATAGSPSALHSGWTKRTITGACDKFPSYLHPDFPKLAYNASWLAVEVSCINSSAAFGGQEIHVIEKSSFYNSGTITDHKFTSSAPSTYLEAPLNSLNGDLSILQLLKRPTEAQRFTSRKSAAR